MAVVLSAILILSVAIGCQIAISPPQRDPPKDQRRLNDLSKFMTTCMFVGKHMFMVHATVELLLITIPALTFYFPGSNTVARTHAFLVEYLLPNASHIDPQHMIGIEPLRPLRIVGAALVIAGSALRYICYRTLGRHFTFHVTVLPAHKLITSGPYGVVRHPSYIGGYVWLVGTILWHVAPGSWLRTAALWRWPLVWVPFAPCALGAVMLIHMGVRRLEKEDAVLKEEFGTQWDMWAQKVPYRLIPGIY